MDANTAAVVPNKRRRPFLTAREKLKTGSSKEDISLIKSVEIPQAFDDLEFDFDAQTKSFNKQAAILVIDDNHFNLVAAKLLLGEFDLRCDTAISGQKGIKLFK